MTARRKAQKARARLGKKGALAFTLFFLVGVLLEAKKLKIWIGEKIFKKVKKGKIRQVFKALAHIGFYVNLTIWKIRQLFTISQAGIFGKIFAFSFLLAAPLGALMRLSSCRDWHLKRRLLRYRHPIRLASFLIKYLFKSDTAVGQIGRHLRNW